MLLSPNFSLEELTRTDTGMSNNPEWPEIQKLFYLANYILQPIRDRWGPYWIESGFRSRAVNKEVGGEDDSQHLFGEAADGWTQGIVFDVFKWTVDESGILFGQCIYYMENPRIHISLPKIGKPNKEALIYENGQYKPYRV